MPKPVPSPSSPGSTNTLGAPVFEVSQEVITNKIVHTDWRPVLFQVAAAGEQGADAAPVRFLTDLYPGEHLIGRRCDLPIVLADSSVTRQHALLTVKDREGQVLLCDLGSTNGTRRNGNHLTPHEPVALADGDVLRFGDALLIYRGLMRSWNQGAAERGFEGISEFSQHVTSWLRELPSAFRNTLFTGENGRTGELIARALHRKASADETHFLVWRSSESVSLESLLQQLQDLLRSDTHPTLYLEDVDALDLQRQRQLSEMLLGETGQLAKGSKSGRLCVCASTQRDSVVADRPPKLDQALLRILHAHLLAIPPLSQRREDLLFVLHDELTQLPHSAPGAASRLWLWLTPFIAESLLCHDWPGGRAEVQQFVARLVASPHTINLDGIRRLSSAPPTKDVEPNAALPTSPRRPVNAGDHKAQDTLRESGREFLTTALRRHRGQLHAMSKALGQPVELIERMLVQFKLSPSDFVDTSEFLKWRREKNLTQSELAKLLGVSQRAVSDWDQGAPIAAKNLAKLAQLGYVPK